MFCRFCGAHIADDSIFCQKCGKRLGKRPNPRLDSFVKTFYIKTPYPYFALLLCGFLVWAAWPRGSRADYAKIKWSIELDRKLDLPETHRFEQSLSLVLENTSKSVVRDIPVDLVARIDPPQPAEVVAGFLGRKLLIMQKGKPLPLTIVLADPVEPAAKRRYFLEGDIDATPPFKVTFEVRGEDQSVVLAHYVIER
jgi:hypothetical protein